MASAEVPSTTEIRRDRGATEENSMSQKKGKTEAKVDTSLQLQDDESAARQNPSRRRLSSGGLLRKSQKKLTKRPALVRSHTLGALFSSRRKKNSAGCDNVLSKGKFSSTPFQRQNNRDRSHSTPLLPKSEENQDVEVFNNNEEAHQMVMQDEEKDRMQTNDKTVGTSLEHDSDDCSVKSDHDNRDMNKISYPSDDDKVHDLSFDLCSAGVTNDKLSKIQLPSHDIFSRNAHSRYPIRRNKRELRRQSLPVPLRNNPLRRDCESELRSHEELKKYHKIKKDTEKVDGYSHSTFKEGKQSPNTLKGFKTSLLGVFLEQKELGEVDDNNQHFAISQQNRLSSRRFSLPSRIQNVYSGVAENNKPLTDRISKSQDFESDLDKDSENKIIDAQRDYESKENRNARKNSSPHVFLNHLFSNSKSSSKQKHLSSNTPRRTKSLPGLSQLNNSEMEGDFKNKVIFKSTSVNSLDIDRPTQVLDECTGEKMKNEFGHFSKTTFSFDDKNSMNTISTSDLNDEIQQITRCVENVIHDFYKHKEQCDQTSVRYEHEKCTHAKPDKCANTSFVNNMGEFSELQLGLEKEKLKGLGNLATSVEDLEINSKITMSSGELGQDVPPECEDKIMLTEIERSPELSASLESISLEQTTNCIYDSEIKDNYSAPVELQMRDCNGDEMLRNGHLTTGINQELLHSQATEQQDDESSEKKQLVPPGERNANDNLMKGNDSLSNASAVQEPTLHEGSLGAGQINNCSLLDQLAVENFKAGEERAISLHEKSVVEVSKSIKDNDVNNPFCATKVLNFEQNSANKTIPLPKENVEKQSKEVPQHQGSATTSEVTPTIKRAEEKSKYVENSRVILYSVIQSLVEELFCQVQVLNNKTDITTDTISTLTVEKSVAENALGQNENKKVLEKISHTEGGLSIETEQTQNDIIELCVPSGDATVSGTTGHHIKESSPLDVKNIMTNSKTTKEVEEKNSQVEDKEATDKLTAENAVMSRNNEEEIHSKSLDLYLEIECEARDNEEFENAVEEILENVTDVEGETNDNFTEHQLLGSEREHFVNATDVLLQDNVSADFEDIESGKGQNCGSIYPAENGMIQNILTQHEKHKVNSEILRPEMQNINYSECSSVTALEFNEEPQSFDEQDHTMENLTSLNVGNVLQKPIDPESFYSCETEMKITKVPDNQQLCELENAKIENKTVILDSSQPEVEPGLDEGKSRGIVDLVNSSEMSQEKSEKDNIKIIENCFDLSDKLKVESTERMESDSVDRIQLPKIVVPCETVETITREKKSNNKDNASIKQEVKEEPEKHSELDITGNSQNSHEECIIDGNDNNGKPLKLELNESESGESVGSPIERLSQELDAFDISPFNRPRVSTLPLTNHMEKIVEAPCELSPDIEKKEFPEVFSKSLSSEILHLRKTGSLCRDARKRKIGKTQRSFSAPSTTQRGTKHDLYPLREEPEAVELTMEERLKLFEKLLSKSLKTVLEPDFTRSKSPLHRAIAKERFDCVEFLIECGVDINANDESGWPPLHVAVTKGSFDCAVFLVEAGADLGGYTDLVMSEYKRLRKLVYCRTI